ncbi:hypothetical protein AAKU55_003053 [Oxalobacteraceae bacterium GrIS 1.11]
MDARQIGKGVGRFLMRVVWPWAAIGKSVRQLSRQKRQHQENILYIKELVRSDPRKAPAASSPSFDDMLRNRPPGAPGIVDLEKRFLRQKRLAIGTCAVFIAMAGYALANGNLLGIATLLSCLPLFFMASLSAQLRLWQLRMRRLSKEERGGLRDFLREINGWYWQVIDPELGYRPGEKP